MYKYLKNAFESTSVRIQLWITDFTLANLKRKIYLEELGIYKITRRANRTELRLCFHKRLPKHYYRTGSTWAPCFCHVYGAGKSRSHHCSCWLCHNLNQWNGCPASCLPPPKKFRVWMLGPLLKISQKN